MIKRTLYFGNPAYLSMSNGQLVITRPPDNDLPLADIAQNQRTIPIEDIGVVLLDNRQITITATVISSLLEKNVAVVTCDDKSMPTGLLLPLYGHTLQNERFRDQLDASVPQRKQLWQQTVSMKIVNQAAVLKAVTGEDARNMLNWSNNVKSGDSDNLEARAAAFYWKGIFPELSFFVRDRYGEAPNNLLNYGYAILRAVIARALVSSGLLPTIGIHHHNRYNAFCLADDIMEPYRPYVDTIVLEIMREDNNCPSLNKVNKERLLSIPVIDVEIDGHTSPLMIAASITASSLNKCFSGESRRLALPEM